MNTNYVDHYFYVYDIIKKFCLVFYASLFRHDLSHLNSVCILQVKFNTQQTL